MSLRDITGMHAAGFADLTALPRRSRTKAREPPSRESAGDARPICATTSDAACFFRPIFCSCAPSWPACRHPLFVKTRK
jgi:hypothetical protein